MSAIRNRAVGCRRSRRKRALDLLGASAVLVATAPLSVGAASAVWVTMGRPILFRQKRVGLDEELFEVLKFRTMAHPKPGSAWHGSDGQRVTPVGRFLRKSSIDELPQLMNVLKGDMSLVGPRPLLEAYLPVYTVRQRQRHQVRPGITGWAQVSGRNLLTLGQRRDLDAWYVENWSFLLDLRILGKTALQVVRGRGAVPVAKMSDVDDQGFEAALLAFQQAQREGA